MTDDDGDRWVNGVFTKMWISGLGTGWMVVELRGRGGEERDVHGNV